MKGGRERKESLVAFGSKRDCCDRNESNPSIGAAVMLMLVVMMRSMWRSTAVILILIMVLGKSTLALGFV